MRNQQSLRSACAYAQSDQSLCLSLEYSIIVKLLAEHYLEFLSLKGGCRGSSESTLIKMSVVGNLMLRLNYVEVYFISLTFFFFRVMFMQAMKALSSLCIFAVSSAPPLLADAISTKISCVGQYIWKRIVTPLIFLLGHYFFVVKS